MEEKLLKQVLYIQDGNLIRIPEEMVSLLGVSTGDAVECAYENQGIRIYKPDSNKKI